MSVTHLDSQCVVAADVCEANMAKALASGLPLATPQDERSEPLAIVGSGPSVRDYLDELQRWPGEIWAINGAYNYLLDSGIIPQGFLGVDPLPGLAEYVKRAMPETTFYISGLADPAVFAALDGYKVSVWFPEQTGVKFRGGLWMVPGGTTAVTRAPFLARMLGFRDITIFGADCSVDGNRYCYADGSFGEDSKAPLNKVMVNGEGPFLAEIAMLKQASQLGVIKTMFDMGGRKLEFKCGGLLDAFLRAPVSDGTDINPG